MLNILDSDNVAQLICIAQSDEAYSECSEAINISQTKNQPNLLFLKAMKSLMQHHINSLYLAAINRKLHVSTI
jgi:hypothetical protein